MSRLFPIYTRTHQHTRTSRTFCIFAGHWRIYPFTGQFKFNLKCRCRSGPNQSHAKFEVILDALSLTFQALAQCLNCLFLVRSLGTGFLSRTLGLPGQRGGIIIHQNDQVRCGFTFATLGLWLVRPVGKGFIICLVGGRMFFPDFVPVF